MKLFSKSLKPEEVINFLKENPDFFIDHPEAIEHLEIVKIYFPQCNHFFFSQQ